MKSLATLRRRLAALGREADAKIGTAERIAQANADAADLRARIAAAIERRQANPTASPGPVVDPAKVKGTDAITRMLVALVRAVREAVRS